MIIFQSYGPDTNRYCVIKMNLAKIILLLEYTSCLSPMLCNLFTHEWLRKHSSQLDMKRLALLWNDSRGEKVQPEESENTETYIYIYIYRDLSEKQILLFVFPSGLIVFPELFLNCF